MSTLKRSHAIHGSIRENYMHSIPTAIIGMCLLYYDQDLVIQFKGKKFEQFLSKQTGELYQYEIKLNPYFI